MTLPLPTLDKLQYDPLVEQARDLLPYLAPGWTDHNAHDPGITLLELFAWLTEANSYRLDRISARSERSFLRLVGYGARPAQVARAVVAFAADVSMAVQAGLPIASANGATRFQTGTPFQVVDARVVALLSSAGSVWTDHGLASSGFRPFGERPSVGNTFYIGLNRALTPVGSRVRLFSVGQDLEADERVWRELRAARGAALRQAQCQRLGACCRRTLREHHGASVAWEYFNGKQWMPLQGLFDGTRALSLCGPVRWRAPSDMAAGGVPGHDGQWFIRCRLACGDYDCAPQLKAILLNAVLARHAADNLKPRVHASNGQAMQRFDVSDKPIVPGSTKATLTQPDGTQSLWAERPDFDRSGSLARHHVVDATRGQVVFGDGRAGRVPDAGATVSVLWQTGGGSVGNVMAGTLVSAPTGLTLTQPFAAWGGAEAETLGAAKARALRSIAQARCAITLQDLEAAALRVPGAPLARAHAVAEFHPQLKHLKVAGCITLVVLSPCVRSRRDPTPALCRAVRRHLDARRPVATEVHVVGPDWTKVSVKARLLTRSGVNAASLRAEAVRRLDAFFDPLTGGPQHGGWPFGRPVYRAEVLALLDALPGVAAIEGLVLVRDGQADDFCNNLALCPHGLVLSGTHEFTVAPETTR